MMASAQVVETPVNVITNSPSQDCTYPDDDTLPTYKYLFAYAIKNILKKGKKKDFAVCPSNPRARFSKLPITFRARKPF